MQPQLLFTLCIGGVLCLTPLSIYIFWLSKANRRRNPVAVRGVWDFAGLLAGLIGFLGSIGWTVGNGVTHSRFFNSGDFRDQAGKIVWMDPVWFACTASYVVIVAAAIWFGLRKRKHQVAVYNIDEQVADSLARELNSGSGEWPVQVSYFAPLRHATFRLPPPAFEEMEKQLRQMMPQAPAARSHPAALWLSAAKTCCLVTSVCCMALLLASPFIR